MKAKRRQKAAPAERVSVRVEPTTNLGSQLWEAANALRGPVDPADFKNYIFPLLFFKRISDTWTAERRAVEAKYPERPARWSDSISFRFQLPEGCHWSDLRKATENVGVHLQRMLDRIEEANPEILAGIFGDVAWGNKERLPEVALLKVIDIFNGIPLGPDSVGNDVLGGAYEYLLKQFADASGKKAGEFFTPRGVVRLLTRILDPQPGESIYDPACGSGGMLVESVNEVREAGGDTRTLRIYGQEVNLTSSAISRMNLFLHDIEDFKVMTGDTLRSPKFTEPGGNLSQFNVVMANPPFSLKSWGVESWADDPWHRAFCGVPPAAYADYAFIQHMVSSMRVEDGRVGVVMPHGVLFRGGVEKEIRRCLLQSDRLEAVIGLPKALFYNTSIPACILVFRANKDTRRRGGVVFVDGSGEFVKDRAQNRLEEANGEAVLQAYREAARGDKQIARVPRAFVELSEIAGNDWDLNIGRYLKLAVGNEIGALEAISQLFEAQARYHKAEADLLANLKEAGYA